MENPAQTNPTGPFSSYFKRLANLDPVRLSGTIKRAVGLVIESQGPSVSVGELCYLAGMRANKKPCWKSSASVIRQFC